MSKAFTKEDDAGEPDLSLARRPALPSGTPNYVTARGLGLLQAELARLESERARLEGGQGDPGRAAWLKLGVQIADAAERIATAVCIDPPRSDQDAEQVRFGASVRIRREDGSEEGFRIVGVDEADPRQGRIAFVAPLARALLGRRVGDAVPFRSPRGAEELEIVAVAYDED